MRNIWILSAAALVGASLVERDRQGASMRGGSHMMRNQVFTW